MVFQEELLNLTLKTLTLDPLAFIIEDFFDKLPGCEWRGSFGATTLQLQGLR